MSHHPCQSCEQRPATEDSLYCLACQVQRGLAERLPTTVTPATCANCRRRPPLPDLRYCRHCVANAGVARKRRANARAKALRDWQAPITRKPA